MNASGDDKQTISIPLPVILGIGLAALVFLVYSGTLGADYIWGDDKDNIYENPHLLSLSVDNLKWMFTNYEYARRYMPIGWLGWAINYQLTGIDPAGFHLGNVLFHVVDSLLIFLFLFRLQTWRQHDIESQSVRAWICAALGAALWALHPLRVEPVAWASGRIYGQATFFLVISWLSYMNWLKEPRDHPRRRLFYLVAVVTYMLSLLTYPIALGGAVVFFFLDWFRRSEIYPSSSFVESWRAIVRHARWKDKIPFLGGATVVLILTLWARVASAGFLPPPTLEEFPFLHRILQAFYVWGYYLWKPFWPVGLSPFYPNLIDTDPFAWPVLGGVFLVIGITALVLWQFRSKPVLLWLWVTYLILLIPLMGLTEHQHVPNDRYNYIADLVLIVAFVGSLRAVWDLRPMRMVLTNFAMLVIAICSFLNIRQNSHWLDTIALNHHMQAQIKDPVARAKVMMSLALVYFDRGELDKSEEIYRHILDLDPTQATAHSNLADILTKKGRLAEAEEHYKKALQILPNLKSARQNLAILLAEQHRLEEAAREFGEILRYYPDNARAHYNLSLALTQMGKEEEARRHMDDALRLQHSSSEATIPVNHAK